MSIIRDAYEAKSPDSQEAGSEDGLSTCPDCGAKVDTVALKKRMDADAKQGTKQRDDALFFNRLEVGSPRDEERAKNRRASDEAQAGLNRTAGNWAARRDTLAAARANNTGRK